MLKITFKDRSYIYFDPISVKFFDSNKQLIRFNIHRDVDTDCSKFRNQVLQHHHKNTKFKDPRNIRILLGHACNFRCKYCQQKHTKKELITDQQLEILETKISDNLDLNILETVQYWGGEPLLYWNEIKKLYYFFKEVSPKTGTCIVTNGSLMNEEICNLICSDDNFSIILSHDGPGQSLRGSDPLSKNSSTLDYFKKLCEVKNKDPFFKNNYDQNFAVNPVLSNKIVDLKTLVEYYRSIFGRYVAIAESIPIIPTNPETSKYAFSDLNDYTEMIFSNLKEIGMMTFNNFKTQFDLFISKLQTDNFKISPTKAQCFTTDPRMLVFDIEGNILPCQTFQASEILENGDSCNCGNISNMDNINMPHVYGISDKVKCQKCLVASFCMGGCPYLINKDTHDIDCKFKFAHYYGLFKYFLYVLLGKEIESVNETVV